MPRALIGYIQLLECDGLFLVGIDSIKSLQLWLAEGNLSGTLVPASSLQKTFVCVKGVGVKWGNMCMCVVAIQEKLSVETEQDLKSRLRQEPTVKAEVLGSQGC